MKKYLLGVFAIALAVGFSAFSPKATKIMKFNGNASIPAERIDKTKYHEVASISCPANQYVCAVEVDANLVNSSGAFISTVSLESPAQNQLTVKNSGVIQSTTVEFRATALP